MDERFMQAVEVVLQHEGGYVNDPNDLGGETNFGISKRSYPDVDIKNLTREQAIAIYHSDWWVRYGYDKIDNSDVATKTFDLAINMGAVPAHRILQRAINFVNNEDLKVDGILGPLTLDAANRGNGSKIKRAMEFLSAEYYFSLAKARPANRGFLLGWLNRAYF